MQKLLKLMQNISLELLHFYGHIYLDINKSKDSQDLKFNQKNFRYEGRLADASSFLKNFREFISMTPFRINLCRIALKIEAASTPLSKNNIKSSPPCR